MTCNNTKFPLWLVLVVGLLTIGVAYQRPVSLDVGGNFDVSHLIGFYEREESGQANFRWTTAHSSIRFRGAGKPLAPTTVRLQAASGRDAAAPPLQVSIDVNGHPTEPLTLTRESALYSVNVPPEWVDISGDISLDFTSITFRPTGDKRDLGFIVDSARVDLPLGATMPAPTQLFWLLLCALMIYGMARSVRLTARAAGLITLFFLLGCAAILATQRLLLTIFTTRMAVVLILAFAVGFGVERALRWMVKLAGWKGNNALPEWSLAILRGLIMVAVALKVGGLLHPNSFIIDAEFHLKYIGYMAEGKPWEQYFGESLALAVMPENEWGQARTFIPYSPFFYVVAAPLAWLPIATSISVPAAMATLEAVKIAFVFLLGLGLGRRLVRREYSAQVAVVAAAFYSLIPATFLLQQWGNWPTQLSLCLVTLWAAVATLYWKWLERPLVWCISTLLLTLTMLSYTVTAVYTGLFAIIIILMGWFFAREERRKWTALALSLVASTGLALLIYYGQYIGRVLGDTLPTLGQAIETQGSLTTLRPTFWGFITDHLARAMQSYNLTLVYAIGLAGAILVVRRRVAPAGSSGPEVAGIQPGQGLEEAITKSKDARVSQSAGQKVWLGAWLLTFPLFTIADFWVDQALKEFWFVLPALSVVAALWLITLGRRASRIYGALLWLIASVLSWQCFSLWVFRLFFH